MRKGSQLESSAAIKALAKKFGPGFISFGSGDNTEAKAVPTGHDDLDCVLTDGASGVFRGGILEFFGSEGSGKSSIALRTVGNAQKMGLACCWIDAESGFDEGIAKLNGVDTTKLLMPDLANTKAMADEDSDALSLFNSAEVLEMIYQCVCSQEFGLVVVDSVAGLIPERILREDFDPNSAGISEVARNMGQMLGKIAAACKKTDTSVIFINQLRDQPGAYMQKKFHTPGGRALKFFAHQRIGIERIGGDNGKVYNYVDGQKQLIGHYARITIVKNKKAPPVPEGTSIEVPIYYCEYFPDDAKKAYDLARKMQVVKSRNGVMTWKGDDEPILQKDGESSFLLALREGKLEARLAKACVDAEAEYNKDAKNPIKVNTTLRALAETYQPVAPSEAVLEVQPEEPKKTTGKGRKNPNS